MRPFRIPALMLLASCVGLGACGPNTRTVPTAEALSYEGPAFRKILVIGVADIYENRTRYERSLATRLREAGTPATAYHVTAGGNTPIVRETIERLAQAEQFDAVLISRVTNRDSDAKMKSGPAAAKATRRDADKPLDLFRYDYEELNEPDLLDVEVRMTILTELFAIPKGDKVWSVETTVTNVDTLLEIILETSADVAERLQKDGIIAHRN